MSSAWKLRDDNNDPDKRDVYPPNTLLKLESNVCPIIPNNDVSQEIAKYGKTIDNRMSIVPLASYPCLTPKLLMAISGSAWHHYIPTLHLFKLYIASLSVLHNTDGYTKSIAESEFKHMESRLLREFTQDTAVVSDEEQAQRGQKEFTFKSIRLLEYQILTALGVDQSKWAELLSRRCDRVDPTHVNQECKDECALGADRLFAQRAHCTKGTNTALAYNLFISQSNSKVDNC